MSCIFCERKDIKTELENELALAFFDSYPVNEGHMLIIPKRHFTDYFEATEEEILAINNLLHKAKKLLQKSFDTKIMNRKKMGLIITHTGYILDFIEADKAYVMIDGTINCSGNPHEIFEAIQKNGFEGCKACLENK